MVDPDPWRADIETRVRNIETNQAVNAERYDTINQRLNKIDGHVTWLIRLMIGALIASFMAFVAGGGLSIVTGG